MFFWFKNKTKLFSYFLVQLGLGKKKKTRFRKQWIWPPSVVSVIPLETPS